MSAGAASVIVAVVGVLGTAGGAIVQAWRSRRRETVDIAAQWQATYRDLLQQFAGLREQLERESEARLALEGRLSRAMRRIDYLEEALRAAGVEFNGPQV